MVRGVQLSHLAAIVATGAVATILFFAVFNPRATLEADLSLSGTVAAVSEVAVTPTAAASAINLAEGASETSLKVADVFERSNVAAGYTVTVSSANLAAGGRCGATTSPCLFSAAAATALAIDLKKGAASLLFAGGTATWSDVSALNLSGATVDANIAYTVASLLPQAVYTEVLTFTITAK